MTQMQPLDVLGIVLEPIQIILGQIEQKLSKKAKNTKLAITLNCTSGMNSFFVTNDNFCMQKQWQVQKKKVNFFGILKTQLSHTCPLNYVANRPKNISL